MVTDPSGAIGTVLELPDCAAKKGSGRIIPLHEDLRITLAAWRAATPSAGPVIVSERGGPMPPQSIVVWFANAYRVIGDATDLHRDIVKELEEGVDYLGQKAPVESDHCGAGSVIRSARLRSSEPRVVTGAVPAAPRRCGA
jgi:integrase